jgi:uncharacterized phage-associated protein
MLHKDRTKFGMKTTKQINALLYAIEEYPEIGRTKLMKFVFFVDLVMYNRKGETLLQDEYIRMPHGPVPPIAYTLTACSNEFFTVSQVQIYQNDRYREYRFTSLKKADMSLFDNEQKIIFDKVLELLKKNTAVAISTLTHQLDLWKIVGNGYKIPLDLFKLEERELTEQKAEPAIMNENMCDIELQDQKGIAGSIEVPVTALLSERALAKEWLKPAEDKAWDYL